MRRGKAVSDRPAARPNSESRLDTRYVGPVAGCYTLSERRDLGGGNPKVYACRTQSISATSIAITAPVKGAEGEWLTARFDGLGIVRGCVERRTGDGFVFQVSATPEERTKLAASIAWLKSQRTHKETDKREHRRFRPRDPRSQLRIGDGEPMNCFVIDLSRGGAAVSAATRPEIGEIVTLNTLAGKVVRHLDVGFAMKFAAQQDADEVERLATGAALATEAES